MSSLIFVSVREENRPDPEHVERNANRKESDRMTVKRVIEWRIVLCILGLHSREVFRWVVQLVRMRK